jgi:glycosyltransferase involved in cell wall biosynthesis
MSAPLRLGAYTDATIVGGAEGALATLLEWLRPNVAVTLLGVDERVVAEIASARPGCATVVLPPVRNKADLRAIAAHLRAFRRLRPEVAHINLRTPFACQYGIAAALATPGARVIAVEHAPMATEDTLQRGLRRLMVRRLAAHVSVGDESARMVEGMVGLAPGSVRTIYNGVPDFDAPPVDRPVPGPTIGSIGRLSPEKGLDVLLRALVDLPGVTAVLVGDGPERDALEQLALELGVADRAIFTGRVPESRVYFPVLDVYVLASRNEGLPLALVEAMLASRPVAATDVGSVSEAIADGETGLLVPPDDAPALARALRSLLDDPARAAALGEAARARAVEAFSAQAMARQYEELYDEVRR